MLRILSNEGAPNLIELLSTFEILSSGHHQKMGCQGEHRQSQNIGRFQVKLLAMMEAGSYFPNRPQSDNSCAALKHLLFWLDRGKSELAIFMGKREVGTGKGALLLGATVRMEHNKFEY